jgi:magnesium transporter
MKLRRSKSKNSERPIFASPGTPKYIGKENISKPILSFISYNLEALDIKTDVNLDSIIIKDSHNNWLDINGLHDTELINKVSNKFNLHPLLVEDILNTIQKPKLDIFSNLHQLFITLKIPKLCENDTEFETEHVGIVLGKDYILTFQEKDSFNAFQTVPERLKKENSKTKKSKTDYLFFVLLDIIIDNYFLVLDHIDNKIENLSEKILLNASDKNQNELFYLKKEIFAFRKVVYPLKDILSELIQNEEGFFTEDTSIYLRDVYDHVREILDNIDSFKEEIESLTANFHSQMSNKMNQVMKTLTVFTAIFMPLTFIVGVYGMNFDNMPELKNPQGYYYSLLGMLGLAIGLWIYFKIKKYI